MKPNDLDSPIPIFLSRKDLWELGIRVSASTLLRWEQASKFPKRVKLGGTTVAWPRDLVMQWCEDRIAEADKLHYAKF